MDTSHKVKEADPEAPREYRATDPLQQADGALTAGDSNSQYNHADIPKTISAKLKDFSSFWKAVITLLILMAVFGLVIALLLRPEEKKEQLPANKLYVLTEGMARGVRFPNVPSCGLQPPVSTPSRGRHKRIVNGARTKDGEYPWTVFITPNPNNPKSMFGICGGVLINENWILTAAHCLYKATSFEMNGMWMRYAIEDFKIMMGSPYRNSSSKNSVIYQERTLETMYIHPKYFSERTIQNYDFAMLKVKEPFVLNDYVSPVCMAQPSMDFPSGLECTVAGWGSISNNLPKSPMQQRNTWIPLVSNEECVTFTKTITKRLVPYVTDEKICAGFVPEVGSEGTGACEGDSGSGLVCEGDDGRWYAVGLVSVGNKCGEISFYTRLSEMMDFVSVVLSDNPPQDDVYCDHGNTRIWPEQVCDGTFNCLDFSDENNCECSDKHFRCDNGLCKLTFYERCNGENSCGDASDERNCTYFECDNGQQYSLNFVCDGDFDCEDHTDEAECDCVPGQFRCNNTLCRPLSWRCDGEDDCEDGSDEHDCECTETSFRCANGGCVPRQNVCDLMDNCGDFSDEDYCNCTPDATFACEIQDIRMCAPPAWQNYDCTAIPIEP